MTNQIFEWLVLLLSYFACICPLSPHLAEISSRRRRPIRGRGGRGDGMPVGISARHRISRNRETMLPIVCNHLSAYTARCLLRCADHCFAMGACLLKDPGHP
ncbi:hypothetical protein CDAR_460161 [Caerostris darwini]|uniref:Secreted protein n=1 Tax=Caerostris darwini TaxID=1538125 RepID=A0AAV4R8R0_9ARAC|nr:hypothetical protein CDAR_460161 [Caerostris darwini]